MGKRVRSRRESKEEKRRGRQGEMRKHEREKRKTKSKRRFPDLGFGRASHHHYQHHHRRRHHHDHGNDDDINYCEEMFPSWRVRRDISFTLKTPCAKRNTERDE